MDLEQIKEKLCYNDERNPYYLNGEPSNNCFCDNCFYGRTQLAEEILRLRKIHRLGT